MRFFLLLLLATLVAAGCSGVEPSADAGEPGTTVEEPTPRWRGARAQTYRRAYRICSVFTVEEIARQRDMKLGARTAARAFARWHTIHASSAKRASRAASTASADARRAPEPRLPIPSRRVEGAGSEY